MSFWGITDAFLEQRDALLPYSTHFFRICTNLIHSIWFTREISSESSHLAVYKGRRLRGGVPSALMPVIMPCPGPRGVDTGGPNRTTREGLAFQGSPGR